MFFVFMIRRPPGCTRPDTLFPDTPLCRSLEKRLRGYQHAQDQIAKLAHRFDAAVLEALLEHTPVEPALWNDPVAMQGWLDGATQRLAASGLGKPHYRMSLRPTLGDQPAAIEVVKEQHGLSHTRTEERRGGKGGVRTCKSR